MAKSAHLSDESCLRDILKTFSFLTENYPYSILPTVPPENLKAKHWMVYRSENAQKQIEICADESWFHCEIRRLIQGIPAKYSDRENCFGFEALAILESQHNYDHMAHFVAGKTGLKGVLKHTAQLFLRHSAFFTTDSWIDLKRVEQLRADEFERKFGMRPNPQLPTFWGELKKEATPLLIAKGYTLITDSEELSPFDDRGMEHFLTFQDQRQTLHIAQLDWRDDYHQYFISINGKMVFEMDTRKQGIFLSVSETLKFLADHL